MLYKVGDMVRVRKDLEVQGTDKYVGIYRDKNKVIAVNLETGKEGVARCHPDDAFDFYTGAKLALERLEESEKPYAWLKKGTKYYVPDIVKYGLYSAYTYDADGADVGYKERGIMFKTREEAIACAKMLRLLSEGGSGGKK